MTASRHHKIASGILFAIAFPIFGAMAGGFTASKILPTSDMGWDQIAQALGGVMVGGAIALPLAAVAVWKLPPRALYFASAAAVLGAAALIALARAL
jgi:hypothetical protein